MPIAFIAFDFDPLLSLTDDLVVRWQTLALAAVIAACLIAAGLMARRATLRADDLLYIAIGAVPGAILLGRLGYGLDHLDAFGTDPLRLLDPSAGGLDLAAGVVGGVIAGVYVASLLGASVARWAHLAALVLLVAIGAGKLTMVLGGSGQGLPSDAWWATAFLGPGPWASLAPRLPSDPSQAYEAIAALLLALGLVALTRIPAVGRPDGRLLLIAIAGWALARTAISTSWRDPVVVGRLGAPGLLSLIVAGGSVVVLIVLVARSRRTATPDDGAAETEPAWPEPSAPAQS